MRLLRAKHLILTVTTMFALFVSAVSACACSHHEPVKVETASSCHSSSHDAPPPAEVSTESTHLEADCNCFVRTPVPAIVAKKDDKRTVVDEKPADLIELATVFVIADEPVEVIAAAFEPPQSDYQLALLASLPSRAPPRL